VTAGISPIAPEQEPLPPFYEPYWRLEPIAPLQPQRRRTIAVIGSDDTAIKEEIAVALPDALLMTTAENAAGYVRALGPVDEHSDVLFVCSNEPKCPDHLLWLIKGLGHAVGMRAVRLTVIAK